MFAWQFQLKRAGPIVSSPIPIATVYGERTRCARHNFHGVIVAGIQRSSARSAANPKQSAWRYTFPGYTALYTVILNLIVTVVLTPVFNAIAGAQTDATVAADYRADARVADAPRIVAHCSGRAIRCARQRIAEGERDGLGE